MNKLQKNEHFQKSKTYKIFSNIKKEYELILNIDNDKLLFEIIHKELNEKLLNYKAQYKKNEVIKLLNLSHGTKFEELFLFLNNAFDNKKIKLFFKDGNAILFFINKKNSKIILRYNNENIFSENILKYKDNNITFLNRKRLMDNNNIIYTKTNIPNFKYKKELYLNNESKGINDIFEVFTSLKDNIAYLLCLNSNNYNIDILNLFNYSFINSLKGHNNHIISIRYFNNKNQINNDDYDEYLLSSDESNFLIIWEIKINNNYEIKHIINTGYIYESYSSLLLLNANINNININERNFIITSTSTFNQSFNNEKCSSKLYSLNSGSFIKTIFKTSNNKTYYIIIWYNKLNKDYYIIELCQNKIMVINIFKDEIYSKFIINNNFICYNGFISNYKEKDHLFACSTEGCIYIIDLANKNYNKIIENKKNYFCNIMKWSSRYLIISDYKNKCFEVVDIIQKAIITEFKEKIELKCIKNFKHPIYGETLLTCGNDNKIKLWTI